MEERCPNCGSALGSDGICDYCGYQVKRIEPSKSKPAPAPQPTTIVVKNVVKAPRSRTQYVRMISPKHKWTAFLWCFFFGVLGAHRFYVGKTGTAILYLFTCGLCGIGWIFDLFKILFGSFTDANGLPLKK